MLQTGLSATTLMSARSMMSVAVEYVLARCRVKHTQLLTQIALAITAVQVLLVSSVPTYVISVGRVTVGHEISVDACAV